MQDVRGGRLSIHLLLIGFWCFFSATTEGSTYPQTHLADLEEVSLTVRILDLGLTQRDHKGAWDRESWGSLESREKKLRTSIAEDLREIVSVKSDNNTRVNLVVLVEILPDWKSGMCAVFIQARVQEPVFLARDQSLIIPNGWVPTWQSRRLHLVSREDLSDELDQLVTDRSDRLLEALNSAR